MNIEFLNPVVPEVFIEEKAFAKICHLLKNAPDKKTEIAFMGTVDRAGDLEFYVTDIVVPPQEKNSGAWVETSDALGEWIADTFKTIEERKSLRFHGHSHPTFATNPSGTDQQFYAQMMSEISDYYIRMIINNKLEINCDMFIKDMNLNCTKISVHINCEKFFLTTERQTGVYKYSTYKHVITETVVRKGQALYHSDYFMNELGSDRLILQPNEELDSWAKLELEEKMEKPKDNDEPFKNFNFSDKSDPFEGYTSPATLVETEMDENEIVFEILLREDNTGAEYIYLNGQKIYLAMDKLGYHFKLDNEKVLINSLEDELTFIFKGMSFKLIGADELADEILANNDEIVEEMVQERLELERLERDESE